MYRNIIEAWGASVGEWSMCPYWEERKRVSVCVCVENRNENSVACKSESGRAWITYHAYLNTVFDMLHVL